MRRHASSSRAYRTFLNTAGILTLVLCSSSGILAQLRIVGSISGTVQDPTGAVIANARVVLKDQSTGIAKEVTSTERGTFLFPDLASGSYEITVTSPTFQSARVTNINVSTNQVTDVKINMEVGPTTETVTVNAVDAQTLETSSQLVATTLETQSLAQLPVANRSNVLALARLAPGASPPAGGDTRYNNLAGGAVNVTVDGINNASNGFKSGGTIFFATVPSRLGAVDEVTVETAGLGADSGAQSGANIKFTTRRGGNQYHGSGFYELRSEQLAANSWSRNAQGLPRVYNRNHEYGGNFGGPLVPHGSWKEKLFFFVNFENRYNPQFVTTTIAIPTADALKGIYTYVVSGTTNQLRTANVLDLAAAKGLPTKLDSVSQSILNTNTQIPTYARPIADNDFNRDTYTFDAENNLNQYFPTTRVDYYITPKQQFTFTWNYYHSWQPGARRLPVPDIQRTNPFRIGYFVYSGALQSTLSPQTLNEFRYGVQHSGDTNARDEYGPYYTFDGKPLRIGPTLQFSLAAPNPLGPLVPFIDQPNTTGRHFITTIYDTLTLNRGQHTFTVGGSYRKTDWKDIGQVFPVPTYATGTPSGDPLQASSAFTAATLPGINSTLLGDPLALYNLLTGRVSSSGFTKVVNPDTLQYNGFENFTWTASRMGGAYAQDRWRIKRSLTLNYGLRWEVQGAMYDVKGITAVPDLGSLFGPSTQLFTPGQLSGNNNPTVQVGHEPYKTDWLNFAPNVGFAWNPERTEGLLGKILGGSKTVIRGNYSTIVYDEGTQFFAQNLGTNAGKTIAATTLIPGQSGQTSLPAFYTLSDIVANPLTVSNYAFATSSYNQVINQADQTFARTISGFDPNLRAPYTENYSIGIQREFGKNSVLEVRYVGNQSRLAWRTSNLNEVNIFENGFLNEFKNAQKNLAINQAAGTSSFQNLGRTGQVPLPIFDAAFGPRGSLAAIAAGSGYTSTAFISNLQNGEAGVIANTLATNQNYVCRMFGNTFSPCARVLPAANAPGPYPINFFVLNPYVAGRMNFTDNGGWHSYNGLQIQFRQRLSQGLNWTTNYTLSKSLTNLPADNANQSVDYLTLRNPGLDRRVSPFDIRHVLQTFGTYELPFGHGKWLSVNNQWLDRLVGGWVLGSVFVFNTGQPLQLTGGFDTVNSLSNNTARNGVRLAPGVTVAQIQDLFNASLTRVTGRVGITDLQRLAVDPRLIGPDGRANPQYLLPNTTPGEFGQSIFIRDKNTFQWDLSVTKAFRIRENVRFELFSGFSNILNHPRWAFGDTSAAPPGSLNVFSTTFGIIGAPTGNRALNLRGTLSF